MDLDIHLAQCLLHVQGVLGGHLQQAAAVAPQCPQRADFLRRAEARSQQPDRMQVLNPLAVGYVALAAWNALPIMGVDQANLQAARLQQLEQRNPVHAR